MPFYADLHIHSKYSRACSRDCDLEHLAWWARRKGVTVVGSGDFTHPAWFEHLRENLEPAEPGLFRLREELDRGVERTLPASCRGPVRFMLSVEISTIYKRAERTRKVHHLVYVPDLEAAERFNRRLGRIGNIASDGRPILGLDSRDLLEITLESGPGSYLVPAHAWTPWFAVLGSKSGFDAVDDCYLDQAPPGALPGVRQAAQGRGDAPGRGAGGPAGGRPPRGRCGLPQPDPAPGDRRRDPAGGSQEQGGRRPDRRADRAARAGAGHPHHRAAGRGRAGRLVPAGGGPRPPARGPGAPRGRLRRRVRRDPPVRTRRAGAAGQHGGAVRAAAPGRRHPEGPPRLAGRRGRLGRAGPPTRPGAHA